MPDNIFSDRREAIENYKNGISYREIGFAKNYGGNKVNKPKVIVICGSLRFQDEQMRQADRLELEGNAVISVVYPAPGKDKDDLTPEQGEMLGKMHNYKIGLADAIFVVNPGGYIGNATRAEIEHAKSLGKEIMYLEQPQ